MAGRDTEINVDFIVKGVDEVERGDEALDQLGDTAKKTDKSVKETGNSFEAMGKKMQGFGGKMEKVGKGMTDTGTAMAATFGAGAIAIGAGLGKSVKTAMNFEAAMSKVGAVSGATGKDFDDLSKIARDMGATTQFSASEAAEGLNFMAMAGYDTKQMIGSLPGVLSLAAAGGTDLAVASDIVTDAMTGLGMSADQTTKFADIMAATITKSNTSVEMMGETMKYVAPVAGALGISMEDLSVVTGLMANAGVKGSQAGTALRSGLTRLIKPPKEAASAMKEFNIEVAKNSDGTIDLANTMQNLRSNLSGLDADTQAVAISSIFGQEAMSGWSAAINATESDFDGLTQAIANSDGKAAEIAERMNDNLAGAFKTLNSAVEEAQISIGEQLIPVVKWGAETVNDLVNSFNGLSPGMKKFIAFSALGTAALFAFLGIIGMVLVFAGMLVSNVGVLVTAFGSLTIWFGKAMAAGGLFAKAVLFLTGPIGITIGVILALATALIVAWKTSDRFRDAVTSGWNFIKETAIATFGWLVNFFGPIFTAIVDKALEFGRMFVQAIKDAFAGDFSGIFEIFKMLFPTIVGIMVGGLPGLLISASRFLPTIVEGIESNQAMIVQTAQDIMMKFATFLSTNLPLLVEQGVQIIHSIAQGIATNYPIVMGMMADLLTYIVGAVVTYLPMLLQAGVDILTSILNGIVQNLPTVITAIVTVLTFIVQTVVTLLPILLEAGLQILMGLIQGVITMLPILLPMVIQILQTVVELIISLLPMIINAGIEILQALITGIILILPALIVTAIFLITTILDTLIQLLPVIIDAGVQILLALIDGIKQMLPVLIAAAIELLVALVTTIVAYAPQLLTLGVQLIQALIDGALQLLGAVGAAAGQIGSMIMDTISKINLVQVGKDIIQGLINGVTSMFGAVGKAIGGIADKIKGGIAKAMDTHSPSRWMRDYIGKMIPAGIAVGIEDNTRQATRAATDMSENVRSSSLLSDIGKLTFANPVFELVEKVKPKAKPDSVSATDMSSNFNVGGLLSKIGNVFASDQQVGPAKNNVATSNDEPMFYPSSTNSTASTSNTSNFTENSTNNAPQITININGGGNAQETATRVREELEDLFASFGRVSPRTIEV